MDVNASIQFLRKHRIPGVVDGEAKGPCIICCEVKSVMNSHHTVPRACGGEHSLQVSLCAGDHDALHYYALALVSNLKGKKKKQVKQYWKTEVEYERAKPLVAVLVDALMQKQTGENEGVGKLIVADTIGIKKYLKVLKADLKPLGLKNQDQVVMYCIINTLVAKGILNENEARKLMRNMQVSQSSQSI